MNTDELKTTADAMVAKGKGILAMDESTPTIGKRLEAIGVENTEQNRMAYRELLLGTPGLGDYVSGAILYDETIRQKNRSGVPFTELMEENGIMAGIKVDTGAKTLALHDGEKITEGLDGLRGRLKEYKSLGARFCKWRAVITVGEQRPSRACIRANAHMLARYAALCQEVDLVPIVEPEVLLDGDHSIERSYQVTVETQREVFDALHNQGVLFDGMILKPSMVIAGAQCARQADVYHVADLTLQCLRSTVPAAVPGIAFLSGGQSDEKATMHLNIMNVMAQELDIPWRLTFSYARALQQPTMAAWQGDERNLPKAQTVLLHRARLNSAASRGIYDEAMEEELAA